MSSYPGEYVEDYMLDDERKFTGYLVDGVPEGPGTLTWILSNCVYVGEFHLGKYDGEGAFYWNNLGDKLLGTFSENAPVEGTYTYSNTMHYTGPFNSAWQFDGQGLFDWNMFNDDGSVKSYGWLYEGQFSNGTMVGCVGTITFATARDGSKGEGIYTFTGLMDGFPGIKKDQYGEGEIHFGDKSVYSGGLYYSAGGDFLRYGDGIQYFLPTGYRASQVGGSSSDYWYAYAGKFDGINHGWIYGNGVNYFVNASGKPSGYVKGEWNGINRIADWMGEWDKSMLLEGWEDTEEVPYSDGYYNTIKAKIEAIDATDLSDYVLLVGHSHFTNWASSTTDLLGRNIKSVNLGVGGSTADWWQAEKNMALFDLLPSAPKMIVLAIGNNDMAEGATVETTLASVESLLTKIHAKFPDTLIAYSSQFVTPLSLEPGNLAGYKKLYQLNSLVTTYILETDFGGKVSFMDVNAFVYDDSLTSGPYYDDVAGKYLRENIWEGDSVHMNLAYGYPLFTTAIADGIDAILK